MIFLKSFRLPSWEQEERGNLTPSEYPYGIFPFKQLKDIEFKDITIFYHYVSRKLHPLLRMEMNQNGFSL
ncbi:MAG: hypothetical protein N4A54_00365 [Peptostreptococcaceae bacterium]|jgi:hypothetical protein|nr:hypothetical protein [Peptostreptococcaceae bacterium]